MTFRNTILITAGALALLSAPAMAQDVLGKSAGAILVRGRLIEVAPWSSPSSTTIGGSVSVSDSLAPEVDFSYFVTDNIAFELIAATTSHTLTAKDTKIGSAKVGTTMVLPPTLTAQYHFLPKERFSPYVGAGLNWTFFYNTKAAAPFTSLGLSNNLGAAVQVGMDVAVGTRSYINVDLKQIFLHTDASINHGAVRAKTDLNPLVAGIGFGYRF